MFRSTFRLTARTRLPTRAQTPRSVLTRIVSPLALGQHQLLTSSKPTNTVAHSRSIYITGGGPISDTSIPSPDPFADHCRIRYLKSDHAALQTEVRQLAQKLKELEGKVAGQNTTQTSSKADSNYTGSSSFGWYEWVLIGLVPATVGLTVYQRYLERNETPARPPARVQVMVEEKGKGNVQGGGDDWEDCDKTVGGPGGKKTWGSV